ncbi:hypothetical protein RCIP0062_00028 [Klebsiella phage RCIP0062]
MKKMLALVVLSLGLIGCSEKPKIYDCGSEAFEVNSKYMKVVKGENSGVIIDGAGENQYKLLTPFGYAHYVVNKNTIDVSVGAFHNTLTCEVK